MGAGLVKIGVVVLVLCSVADAGYRTEDVGVELPRQRFRHVAARLGDGSVAVLAGFGVRATGNVLVIHPDFSRVEALDVVGGWSGYDLAGIGLPNGNVLLIDGGVEVVYDYQRKAIKRVEHDMPHDFIRWATLTELSSGRILVSGGDTGDFKPIQTWAVYDPAENRFISFGTMAKARSRHAAVELADGRVLLAGSGDQTAEILDVRSGETTLLDAAPIFERYTTCMAMLDSGRVLLVGGGTEHCELFDPKTMAFSETASLGLPRRNPLLWKHGHEVLVVGGSDNARVIEVFDENAGVFRMNNQLLVYPRSSEFTMTPFDANSALVVGGRVNSGERKLNKIEKITFETKTTAPVAAAPVACEGAPAAVVTVYENGKVKRALPLSGISSGKEGTWCYKKNRSPQTFLETGLADCLEIRLEVAFSPGVPYRERVEMMHMIGLRDAGSIQIVPDLSVEEIAFWVSAEDPGRLLPTAAEIAAVKKLMPTAAKLGYTVHTYDPKGDPEVDLLKSMEVAAREGRHILLQVGGDWCGWCGALSRYFESNIAVSHVLNESYVIQKVNMSTENRNESFLSRFPKIGGFPHLFVLDAEGRLLHSQGTGELEDGGSYHEGAMLEFLNRWTPQSARVR